MPIWERGCFGGLLVRKILLFHAKMSSRAKYPAWCRQVTCLLESGKFIHRSENNSVLPIYVIFPMILHLLSYIIYAPSKAILCKFMPKMNFAVKHANNTRYQNKWMSGVAEKIMMLPTVSQLHEGVRWPRLSSDLPFFIELWLQEGRH